MLSIIDKRTPERDGDELVHTCGSAIQIWRVFSFYLTTCVSLLTDIRDYLDRLLSAWPLWTLGLFFLCLKLQRISKQPCLGSVKLSVRQMELLLRESPNLCIEEKTKYIFLNRAETLEVHIKIAPEQQQTRKQIVKK